MNSKVMLEESISAISAGVFVACCEDSGAVGAADGVSAAELLSLTVLDAEAWLFAEDAEEEDESLLPQAVSMRSDAHTIKIFFFIFPVLLLESFR